MIRAALLAAWIGVVVGAVAVEVIPHLGISVHDWRVFTLGVLVGATYTVVTVKVLLIRAARRARRGTPD